MKTLKHTVLMVTYNQQDLLPIALDSLLSQSVLPYEIIISDDCSTDNTWDIIMVYSQKYPQLIKPIRNEKNLGVFGNMNQLMKMPTGDVISWLSGDDLYKPGIFEAFNKEITQRGADPQKEKFIIISNAIDLYYDGKETIYDNYRFRNSNLFKLKIRYGLNFRETGFSAAMWKQISPIREDIGYHADWIYSLNQIDMADSFYFINEAYPVYRMGVGVVSKSKMNSLVQSKLKVVSIIMDIYEKRLDESDKLFLKKEYVLNQYFLQKNISNFCLSFYYILRNCNNYSTYKAWVKEMKMFLIVTGGAILRKMRLKK